MKRLVSMILVVMLICSMAFALNIKAGDTSRKVCFVAYAKTDANGITPITSITDPNVFYSIDGNTPVKMTTPTVTAIDSTNTPGLFALSIDEPNMVRLPTGVNQVDLMLYISSTNGITVPLQVAVSRDNLAKADVNSCVVGVDWSRIEEPNSVVRLKNTTIRRVFDPNNQNAEGNALDAIRRNVQ